MLDCVQVHPEEGEIRTWRDELLGRERNTEFGADANEGGHCVGAF